MKEIPDDVIADPDDPRLPINEVAAPQVPIAVPPEVAETTAPQALQGITPEAGNQDGVSVEDLPEHPELPPETMVVRGMHYGKHFKEFNRDANYGPDHNELQDDDVALSPNVSAQLGLKRGDKIWVGNRLHTYNDESYYSPNVPTHNAVEVRNYPLDGKIQIRKASPDEVSASLAPSTTGAPLSAMQASRFTGQDPTKITAEAVNQAIQGVPQRALVAGDTTGAAVENWNMDQLAQQNEVAQASNLGDSSGEITPESMGLESTAGIEGGESSSGGEGMPVPNPEGMHITERRANGDLVYNHGEVIAHPSTGSVEYHIGPKTFVRTVDGRTVSYMTNAIYRDPTTGKTYNKNAEGMPEVHLPGQMPDLPAGVKGEAALADLSPAQQNIVRMIANYEMVIPPGAMRSPAFLPYLARVNAYDPNYSMMKAVGRQQMIKSITNMSPNSAGYLISSANTMLEHLQNLQAAAKALPEHDFTKFNGFENWAKKNAGNPAVTNFQTARGVLVNEMSRTLKGGVPDQADITRWDDALNAANSKEQLDGQIEKQFPEILKGRLDGFRFLYNSVMDKPYEHKDAAGNPISLISPHNQEWLKSIGYDGNIDAGDPLAGKPSASDPMRQAVIQALTAAGKVVNEDTIKQTIEKNRHLLQPTPTPTPTP